jgi:hypothetical protein
LTAEDSSLDFLLSFAPFGFASSLLGQAKRKRKTKYRETRGKNLLFSFPKRKFPFPNRKPPPIPATKKAPIGSGLSIIKSWFFISSA